MSSDQQSNQSPDPAPVDNASASTVSAVSSERTPIPASLINHLYKAKALSERLLSVMAQREARLAEIKNRVNLLEPGGESVQPLLEAENSMRDAHTRMKAVLVDLGKELQTAGVGDDPVDGSQLGDIPSHAGQGDEVAYLYKHLLLALGEWKHAQQKLAADRAETLARQVQELRDQVNREQAETQRIRRRKEELDRLRAEKQEELDALKRERDDNEHQE